MTCFPVPFARELPPQTLDSSGSARRYRGLRRGDLPISLFLAPIGSRGRAGPSGEDAAKLLEGRCPSCGSLLLHADREPQSPYEWELWLKGLRKAIRRTAVTTPGRPPDENARCLTPAARNAGTRPAQPARRNCRLSLQGLLEPCARKPGKHGSEQPMARLSSARISRLRACGIVSPAWSPSILGGGMGFVW